MPSTLSLYLTIALLISSFGLSPAVRADGEGNLDDLADALKRVKKGGLELHSSGTQLTGAHPTPDIVKVPMSANPVAEAALTDGGAGEAIQKDLSESLGGGAIGGLQGEAFAKEFGSNMGGMENMDEELGTTTDM